MGASLKVRRASLAPPWHGRERLVPNHAVRRLPVVTADARIAELTSIDDLALRADSHKGAAVPDAHVQIDLREGSGCTKKQILVVDVVDV
jgi:hypothetical protein